MHESDGCSVCESVGLYWFTCGSCSREVPYSLASMPSEFDREGWWVFPFAVLPEGPPGWEADSPSWPAWGIDSDPTDCYDCDPRWWVVLARPAGGD